MPGDVTLVLYGAVLLCGIALLVLSVVSGRQRRDAGFATKAQLRRHLSAKAVLRAAEIRPSLTTGAGSRPRVRPTERNGHRTT
ncbi:hypothetical protein ACFOOM_32620 [Streptomyces echinoruber]|uniref:Uncharacterized protein n=1 Tax=Streptomyces echinoruber TaxID=68898 RepID=A0A918S073_9ACTN|nr:hypothetical protein [Streptomyces echinoruber]GHA19070.1 hypothetical protein GCM10010389_66120 [Streptomyces echinoruber]